MTIDIYSMRLSPPCRAVLMTARQLNIDLNVNEIDLMQGEQLNSKYIKVNPSHTVPTIDDNGFVLWESRAIMQYLCNQYDPDSSLYPKEPKKRAIVDRWLNLDLPLMNLQKASIAFKMMTGVDPPKETVNAFKNIMKLMNELIGQNKYLTGNELTIADLSVLATTALQEHYGLDLTDYPNFKRWQSALKSELSYYEEINHFDKQYIEDLFNKFKSTQSPKTN